MKLKIREAIANDYIDISNLVVEVHNLHVKNRPDVYLKVDNPFLKEQFEDLLNSSNIKLFVVEDTDSKELIAYSIVQIMTPKNIQILIPSKFAYWIYVNILDTKS
jgi:diamine N-acetyltransferase